MVAAFVASALLASRSIAMQLHGGQETLHATSSVDAVVRSTQVFAGQSSRSLSNVATIVAMDMRLPEDDVGRKARIAAFNKHTSGTDVFLCTDKEATNVTGQFENVVQVRFAEDWGGIPPEYKESFKDRVLIQWWRLKHCYAELQRFAAEHQHVYSFIFKTRIDIDVSSRVVEIAERAASDATASGDEVAFVASDYAFGGTPAVMSVIAELFDKKDEYIMSPIAYKPINYDSLFKSDWHAGKFDCLNFPLRSLGKSICTLSYERLPAGYPYVNSNMRSILEMNKTGLTSEHQDDFSAINACLACYGNESGHKHCWKPRFRSENVILMALLNHGIQIKGLGAEIKFVNNHEDNVERLDTDGHDLMQAYFSKHCGI